MPHLATLFLYAPEVAFAAFAGGVIILLVACFLRFLNWRKRRWLKK